MLDKVHLGFCVILAFKFVTGVIVICEVSVLPSIVLVSCSFVSPQAIHENIKLKNNTYLFIAINNKRLKCYGYLQISIAFTIPIYSLFIL